jgi:hypothetical protein
MGENKEQLIIQTPEAKGKEVVEALAGLRKMG